MDDFRKRLQIIAANGMLGMSLVMGHELKLFDALAAVATKDKPANASSIAKYANLKERYVREWLCAVACGDIINIDETGEFFWIDENRVTDLNSKHPYFALAFQQFLPLFGQIMPQIKDVFRIDGPLGMKYESYGDFYRIMNDISTAKQKEHLLPRVLPMIDDIEQRLHDGIKALDVGCGNGFHVSFFAEHFPKSMFTGIDLSLDAVHTANQSRFEDGKSLENAAFLQMNAQKLNSDWADKFDWVTIFDACHDQTRPDLSLKEIHRVLKPDGIFSMFEIRGTSNPYKDKQRDPLGSTYFYAVSMFHCLAVGSNAPDALCLGNMWGIERATKMLKDAGFSSVRVVEMDFFPNNLLYLCKK